MSHHTKRAARSLAWRDERNPFGKFSYSNKKSEISQLEDGRLNNQLNEISRSTTDPSGYGASAPVPHHVTDPARSGAHAYTDPTAMSSRKPHEAGDDIGNIPFVSSPPRSSQEFPVSHEKHGSLAATNSDAPTLHGTEKTHDVASSADQHHKSNHLKFWQKSRKSKNADTTDEDDSEDTDSEKDKKKFTLMSQIRATVFNSWINILLIASPVGIALHFAHADDKAIFVVNFIAIIPLAAMLSYATEEIALRTGEVIGGLLNASFGNAVELIVSIIALTQDQVLIVQTSLIGSILSNLLLVLGMCFFAGGANRMEQAFNMTVAQTASSLLFLAVSALLIPTVFDEWANTGSTDRTNSSAPLVPGVAALSRATAIMLLFVYGCYLFFQLKSHKRMYLAPSEKNKKRDMSNPKGKFKKIIPGRVRRRARRSAAPEAAPPTAPRVEDQRQADDGEEEREEPQLSILAAILTLAGSTVLVALNAEFLVQSIDSITCGGAISKTFVGLILLPIVGNAAEHATAVTVAIKDKMDLAIGVAVGSSMQIALLVLPLVVVLGWIIGKEDMTLYFDGFQIAVLFLAVLLVNYLIQDGKSHWLEGVLLMTLYLIIAVAAWYYPTAPGLSDCPAT